MAKSASTVAACIPCLVRRNLHGYAEAVEGRIETVEIPPAPDGPAGPRQRGKRRQKRQFASKRRRKTLSQFNVLQGRIVHRRNDWIEKTTTKLARENFLVAMKDLDVKAMTKRPKPKPDPNRSGHYLPNGAKAKARLNRSILSNNWSRLMKRLNDKMNANGGKLVIVPAAYTSQTCHKCGHVAKGNRDSQAVFKCVECGYQVNADINAAMNILGRALIQTGGGTA